MEIKNIPIGVLVPYDKNTKKHDEKQVQNVAESIKKYGFVQPIVVDKNNVVVIGHCRLLGAKKLKMKEVPCVCVDDLTDEQVKALRIVDNKTNESEWDFDFLEEELIELDMGDFDFNFNLGFKVVIENEEDEEPEEDESEEEEKQNERERTFNAYNLGHSDLERTAGKYQMPVIRKQMMNPPDKEPIGFNYILSTNETDRAVHFFLDDYQFERIWAKPEFYAEKLAEYYCVFSPDFSLYQDMPIAMQIWNTYRSRLIGQIMQDYGASVIPTVSWGERPSFDFCFDGIEQGSICVVSTIGVKRDEQANSLWRDGMDEMIRRINPCQIWVYGGIVEYDFKGIPVVYFNNQVTERMKGR